MDVIQAIRTQRVVRKFQDQTLPEKVIQVILNSGRRARSSKNRQDWRFIAIRDRSTLKSLSECGTWAGHLAEAALGIAILTPDPKEKFQIMFDAGQTAAIMQLAAWDLGVGSCPASIYEFEKARQLLGFPKEWHLRIALSFGYPENEQLISSPPKRGGRLPINEVVHWERWLDASD